MLEDYGKIPQDKIEKLSKERDEKVLANWHKLMASAGSIEEFADRI